MMKTNFLKMALIICLIFLICSASYCIAFARTEDFVTSAQSAVVMEQSSGRILFEKNADARLPIASTTKILTALTVINNVDLGDVVEIPDEACGVEGSSIYLRAGEHLTVRELLYGLMLRSGNDAAVALALRVSGSIRAFADLMNETAKGLGCKNCNFVNPHGLHDDNHFCSAYDLGLITCNALNNDDFAEIVSTKTVKISNDGLEYDRVLVNKNKLLSNLKGADGVKTGYTKKAGRCFVGSATKDGMQVVAVVLNCGPMFEETENMLNTAFGMYQLQTVLPQNKICGYVSEGGRKYVYVCAERFLYPVKHGESIRYETDTESETPCITVYLDGRIVHKAVLCKQAV